MLLSDLNVGYLSRVDHVESLFESAQGSSTMQVTCGLLKWALWLHRLFVS